MSEQQTKTVDDNELDPMEEMLKRTGCLEEHYTVQFCFADHKDWRKCQKEVKEFKECMAKNKNKQSNK